MEFLDDTDIQFWKYLVTNDQKDVENDSNNDAVVIARGFSWESIVANLGTIISVYARKQHSVFFRVPRLDYMCDSVSYGGKTLRSQGYIYAWINSNRVYYDNSDGKAIARGLIFTRSDNEDEYDFKTTGILVNNSDTAVSINLILYCGGENRLASLDDLNRIWMGIGTKDHDSFVEKCYDNLYNEPRSSYMPTYDYYYDGWTNKHSLSENASVEYDDGLTSLYNTQPGYSGSVVLTGKSPVGNMVLMKNVFVPVILTGGQDDNLTVGSKIIKAPFSVNSSGSSESSVSQNSPTWYTVVGDDEIVENSTVDERGTRQVHNGTKFSIKIRNKVNDIYFNDIVNFKNMQETRQYIYDNGLGISGTSILNRRYNFAKREASYYDLMGKKHVQCVIPKYYTWSTGSLKKSINSLNQEIAIADTVYFSESSVTYSYFMTSNYADAGSWSEPGNSVYYIYRLVYPTKYGEIKKIYSAEDPEEESPTDMNILFRAYGDPLYISGINSRKTSIFYSLNNYIIQKRPDSSWQTYSASNSNTTSNAGYKRLYSSIELDYPIYYFENVGVKVNSVYGTLLGSSSALTKVDFTFYSDSFSKFKTGDYAYTNIDKENVPLYIYDGEVFINGGDCWISINFL